MRLQARAETWRESAVIKHGGGHHPEEACSETDYEEAWEGMGE